MAKDGHMAWYGIATILFAAAFFSFSVFALVGAKLLPPTGNLLVDFLREDQYYSVLVPMALPTTFVAVYISWLGLKLFRHN